MVGTLRFTDTLYVLSHHLTLHGHFVRDVTLLYRLRTLYT